MQLPSRLGRVNGHETCDYTPLQVEDKRTGFIDREHRRYQLGGKGYKSFQWKGDFALGVAEWEAVLAEQCETIDFVGEDGVVYRINVDDAKQGRLEETYNGWRWIIPRAAVVRVQG